MKRKGENFFLLIFGVLLVSNLMAWIVVVDLSQPQFLEVTFFDVGQGDAIFIVSPRRHQILIDGGPTSMILEKLGKEMPFYDRTIDLIILTHPEHDHIAGLIEVLKRYKIDNILWTGVLRDTNEYQEWRQVLLKEQDKEKAKIYIAQAGQKITWSGCHPDQHMEVLFPFEDLEGRAVKNTNNTSIVSKLIFREISFLFTGDAYKSVEKKLLEKMIDSDVFKVGHHGSKTSTSEEFLKEVSPEIAVISVGKENHYGHPHPETLAVLNKYDINILRTDQKGDIRIISDGNNLSINNL